MDTIYYKHLSKALYSGEIKEGKTYVRPVVKIPVSTGRDASGAIRKKGLVVGSLSGHLNLASLVNFTLFG
jgi:hypothetical protein